MVSPLHGGGQGFESPRLHVNNVVLQVKYRKMWHPFEEIPDNNMLSRTIVVCSASNLSPGRYDLRNSLPIKPAHRVS
jgi:hypothetical protein